MKICKGEISRLLAALVLCCLVWGCGRSSPPATSTLLSRGEGTGIIALPVADYCPGVHRDGDRQRQEVVNEVIHARLSRAGMSAVSREELALCLVEEGVLRRNERTAHIDFYETEQWNEVTRKMVADINPADNPSALPEPPVPLDMRKIITLGHRFAANYLLRARLVDVGGISAVNPGKRVLPFYLEIDGRPAVLFAGAETYDFALPPVGEQEAGSRVELQLFLQEADSGNIVWQGRGEVPGAVTSGFTGHSPFQKSLIKLEQLAGELLNDLLRQCAYTASADPEVTVPEETGGGKSLTEVYPVFLPPDPVK